MIERKVTLPDLILWTGTRIAFGAGIGMLMSRRLSKDARKAAGLALTVVGFLTTIPLAISILGEKNLSRPELAGVHPLAMPKAHGAVRHLRKAATGKP